MPKSQAGKQADARYRKEKRKQIVIDMNHNEFDIIDNYCKEHGEAKATLIKRLIFDYISNHTTKENQK